MGDEYEIERRRARGGDSEGASRDALTGAALGQGAGRTPIPGGVDDVGRDEGGAARGGPPPQGSLDDLLEKEPGPVEGAHLIQGALAERRRHDEAPQDARPA